MDNQGRRQDVVKLAGARINRQGCRSDGDCGHCPNEPVAQFDQMRDERLLGTGKFVFRLGLRVRHGESDWKTAPAVRGHHMELRDLGR